MKKQFAAGGRVKMLGKGNHTKSAYPAEPQRPGRTGQHSTKSPLRRTGAKVRSAAIDEAGDMGGSPACRTHGARRLERLEEFGSGRLHPKYTQGIRKGCLY
jgi:hypothetical protein